MTSPSVEPSRTPASDTPRARPKMGMVAVLYTGPETVLEDYGRLMKLAEYEEALPKGIPTLLKINISWQHYYPACSSAPWQIEGVARQLKADGYEELIAAHNGTVVVDALEGRASNKHGVVEEIQEVGFSEVTKESKCHGVFQVVQGLK